MPTTIQPLHNQVLLQMEELGSDLEHILLPEGVAQRYPYGRVLAVGPLVSCCEVDDRVLMLSGNLIGFTLPGSVQPVYLVTDAALLGKYVEEEDTSCEPRV